MQVWRRNLKNKFWRPSSNSKCVTAIAYLTTSAFMIERLKETPIGHIGSCMNQSNAFLQENNLSLTARIFKEQDVIMIIVREVLEGDHEKDLRLLLLVKVARARKARKTRKENIDEKVRKRKEQKTKEKTRNDKKIK